MEVFKVGMEKQRVLEQQNKHSWTFLMLNSIFVVIPLGFLSRCSPFSSN